MSQLGDKIVFLPKCSERITSDNLDDKCLLLRAQKGDFQMETAALSL